MPITDKPVGGFEVPTKGLGWTFDTFAFHQEALRQADLRFDAERDRRNVEGAELRAVALKIKETADLAALTLARDSQTLKEAQNDALRDKTLSESGVYATNSSVTEAIKALKDSQDTAIKGLLADLKPIIQYVSDQQGQVKGVKLTLGNILASLTGLGVVMGLIVGLVNFVAQ